MKKSWLRIGYSGFIATILLLQTACADDPIEPMDPNGPNNNVDTTWYDDSTSTSQNDSTWNDPSGGGNSTPNDSTWNDPSGGGNTTPNDSTLNDPGGSGNTNPNDSLGGGN